MKEPAPPSLGVDRRAGSEIDRYALGLLFTAKAPEQTKMISWDKFQSPLTSGEEELVLRMCVSAVVLFVCCILYERVRRVCYIFFSLMRDVH